MRKAYRVTGIPEIDVSRYPTARTASENRTDAFLTYLETLATRREANIDGDRISRIFFPEGTYDLFISHSHADLGAAYRLRDECSQENYRAFVDSDIWLNVKDLIKLLLERSFTPEYANILHLANNAYIILATALMQMINKANVFVFLDTRNSLPSHDGQRYQTHSPWLKLELETCHLLSQRILTEGHVVTGGMESYREFSYAADIEHLPTTTYPELLRKIRNREL